MRYFVSLGETTVRIEWTRTAQKDMRRIASADRTRIVAKIEQFAADPHSLANNVKALQGSPDFRLRVADYRVIYRIENDTIILMVIQRVLHRREAYE